MGELSKCYDRDENEVASFHFANVQSIRAGPLGRTARDLDRLSLCNHAACCIRFRANLREILDVGGKSGK